MKIEVLVAAMGQSDCQLIADMNIQTDALIGNQCDKNEIREFQIDDKKIIYYSFNERGVSLNRNNTLLRTRADICILADDDMRFVENYEKIVREAFLKNPSADVIIFNLLEKTPGRFLITKKMRITYFNYMRFGAARIAIKRKSISKNNILFHQEFGGGTLHCHGEDTIFLRDCLKAGLKVIAIPEYIAELNDTRKSSWFSGYNRKYFFDQGCLYYSLSKRWCKLLALQDCMRHYKKYQESMHIFEVWKTMLCGIEEFSKAEALEE